MFKPLNQLNAIFDEIISQRLSGNEQLVLLHLFNAQNRAHWTESIRLSDESLRALINQYDSNGKPISLETVRRIKQKLKNKGLIDFNSGKGSKITEYRLIKLYSGTARADPDDTPDDTPDNTPDDTPDDTKKISYIRACEDVKTLRHSMTTTTTARARVSDGIRHRWIQATLTNPTELDEEGLAALEKEFGTEKVFFAIGKANQHKRQPAINLALLESVLRGGEKPQKTKGAMRLEKSVTVERNDDRFSCRSRYDDL